MEAAGNGDGPRIGSAGHPRHRTPFASARRRQKLGKRPTRAPDQHKCPVTEESGVVHGVWPPQIVLARPVTADDADRIDRRMADAIVRRVPPAGPSSRPRRLAPRRRPERGDSLIHLRPPVPGPPAAAGGMTDPTAVMAAAVPRSADRPVGRSTAGSAGKWTKSVKATPRTARRRRKSGRPTYPGPWIPDGLIQPCRRQDPA